MVYLTTSLILDTAFNSIQDNSTELRAKFLSWLNMLVQKVLSERTWESLVRTTTLSISNNAITLPDEFDNVISITGSNWYMDAFNQLSDAELASLQQNTSTIPTGYVIGTTTLTFVPGAVGDVVLKYKPAINTAYLDGDTTIFPRQFLPLLVRSCLDIYYEYDMDERSALSYQLNAAELSLLKRWDNTKKVQAKYSKYIRDLK